MNNEDSEILQSFIDEASDWAEKFLDFSEEIENAGLTMEMVNELFRGIHSLKGTAAFIAEIDSRMLLLSKYCHEYETFLDLIRQAKLAINNSVKELVVEALVTLGGDIDALSEGNDIYKHPEIILKFNNVVCPNIKPREVVKDNVVIFEIEEDLRTWEQVDKFLEAVMRKVEVTGERTILVFDFQGSRMLSSQALGVIFGFREKSQKIFLANPPEYMISLFQRIGLENTEIEIRGSVEACLNEI